MDGVSIREFAKLDGCNEKLVRRGIAEGRLKKRPDGKLDAHLAGTPWRQGNLERPRASATARKARKPERQTSPPPVPADDGEDEDADALELDAGGPEGLFKSKVAADRFNATYTGALKKLEFDLRSGKVVLVEDVAAQVGELLRSVRSQLMALPATIAPLVATLRHPAEVRAVLEREIAAALETLANAADSPEADVRGEVPVPPRAGAAQGGAGKGPG